MGFEEKAVELAAAQQQAMQGLQEAARVFAWDGDSLAVTDANSPVMQKLRKERLSPSTASSMSDCLARWAVEQACRGAGDPFGPAESGTVAHAVLEDLFAQPVGKRTREMAEQLLQTVHERHKDLVLPADPISMARWRDRIRVLIAGLWEIEDPTQVHVLAREKQLSTSEVEGIPFNGFIDRLDLADNGLAIRDYKSGKVKDPDNLRRYGDEQGEQQRLYALAMENLDGVRPSSAWIYYTQFGVKREISLSNVSLNKTRRSFVKAWETLQLAAQTQRYSTKTSGLCAYCPLATVCPTANRDWKVEPRTQDYLTGELLHLSSLDPSPTTVHRPGRVRRDTLADYVADMDAIYGVVPDGDVSDEDLSKAPAFDDDIAAEAPVLSWDDEEYFLDPQPAAEPAPEAGTGAGAVDAAGDEDEDADELELWGVVSELTSDIGETGLVHRWATHQQDN